MMLCLPVEFGDDRGVVAGFVCEAGFFVYITGGALLGQRFGGHNMVDPPAEVAFD